MYILTTILIFLGKMAVFHVLIASILQLKIAGTHAYTVLFTVVLGNCLEKDLVGSTLECAETFIDKANVLPGNWTVNISNFCIPGDHRSNGSLKTTQTKELFGNNASLSTVIGPFSGEHTKWFHSYSAKLFVPHILPLVQYDFDDLWIVKMTLPYKFEEALAISQMIFYMGWSKLLILSENFHYYLRLAQNLWAASETHGIEVKFLKLSRYDETTPNVETDLNEIKKSGYKIIVILASFNVIQSILNETTSVNSISSNWVWILPTDMMNVLAVGNETGLNLSIPDSIDGLLGVRLKPSAEFATASFFEECGLHSTYLTKLVDSIFAATEGLNSLVNATSSDTFADISDNSTVKLNGSELLRHILESVSGANASGFDQSRQSVQNGNVFEILNLQSKSWISVGYWRSESNFLSLNRSRILLAGGGNIVPDFETDLSLQNLKVVVFSSPPFIEVEAETEENASTRLSGFAFQLLEAIQKEIGFTYDVRILSEDLVGVQDSFTGDWNGLIGELVRGSADFALVPIVVTLQRSEAVDFSTSFYKTGLSYIYDFQATSGIFARFGGFGFLLPFTSDVWGTLGVTVFLFACYLTIVSHLSPFGAHGHFFQSEDAERNRIRQERRRSSVMSMSMTGMQLESYSARRSLPTAGFAIEYFMRQFSQLTNGELKARLSQVQLISWKNSHLLFSLFGVSVSSRNALHQLYQGSSALSNCLIANRSDSVAASTNLFQLLDEDEDIDEALESQARRQMSFSNALYFAFAGLLWQSPESVPRAPSSRVAAAVWYMVGVIMVACYTANMVAFVSEDWTLNHLSNARDLVSQSLVKAATLRNSHVNSFLATSNLALADKLYESILQNPGLCFQPNIASAMEEVTSGEVALVWESVVLENIASNAQACRLRTVALELGEFEYAFTFSKNSIFTDAFSALIEKFRENGLLTELENRYLRRNHNPCTENPGADDDSYTPLSFSSLSGVFIMLVVGAIVSFVVLLLEWIVAAFLDVDRRDPTCPATMKRALKLRVKRLKKDVKTNWLFNLKFTKRRRFHHRKKNRMLLHVRNLLSQNKIEPDQWERYTSTEGAAKLKRGQSISTSDVRAQTPNFTFRPQTS